MIDKTLAYFGVAVIFTIPIIVLVINFYLVAVVPLKRRTREVLDEIRSGKNGKIKNKPGQ